MQQMMAHMWDFHDGRSWSAVKLLGNAAVLSSGYEDGPDRFRACSGVCLRSDLEDVLRKKPEVLWPGASGWKIFPLSAYSSIGVLEHNPSNQIWLSEQKWLSLGRALELDQAGWIPLRRTGLRQSCRRRDEPQDAELEDSELLPKGTILGRSHDSNGSEFRILLPSDSGPGRLAASGIEELIRFGEANTWKRWRSRRSFKELDKLPWRSFARTFYKTHRETDRLRLREVIAEAITPTLSFQTGEDDPQFVSVMVDRPEATLASGIQMTCIRRTGGQVVVKVPILELLAELEKGNSFGRAVMLPTTKADITLTLKTARSLRTLLIGGA